MYLNEKKFSKQFQSNFKAVHTSGEVPEIQPHTIRKAFSIFNPFFHASMAIAHIFPHSTYI